MWATLDCTSDGRQQHDHSLITSLGDDEAVITGQGRDEYFIFSMLHLFSVELNLLENNSVSVLIVPVDPAGLGSVVVVPQVNASLIMNSLFFSRERLFTLTEDTLELLLYNPPELLCFNQMKVRP